MKKLFILLISLIAFAAAEEQPLPYQNGVIQNRSGFYFDLTLGGVLRHFEAERLYTFDNSYLGYTEKGMHVSTRFGGIIKGIVAIYGGSEFEYTSGKTSGWDKDRRKNKSFLFGIGPGVTIFPLYKSSEDIRNLYIGSTFNVLVGGGGGIGLLGANFEFETGFLWNTSDRYYTGVAIGGDFYGTGYVDYDHAKGNAIWIAFKVIRK